MSNKLPVGILGATGIVGQRFIQMLEHHPWFEVAWLAASDRSEGRPYAEAARWRLKTAIPPNVAKMTVAAAKPEGAPKIIFAALDSSIARELEPQFAAAGCAVVSNSSALRMQADVPLVIPEVNGDHIQLIETQIWRRKSGGFAVTNPNCSAIGLVMALAPLHRRFTLETVMAVTMQAVSGAGYPGVPALDILGNVVPYIANEEEKMEEETQKLLGTLNGSRVDPAPFAMSAQCNRVAVEDDRVTVDDCWHFSVRIDRQILRLMLIAFARVDRDRVVRKSGFLEEERHLRRVGGAAVIELQHGTFLVSWVMIIDGKSASFALETLP